MKTTLFLKKKNLLLFSLLLLSGIGYSQISQTYNSDGTFTVPAGVTTVSVQAWGAGGAGGGNTFTSDGAGGGGGGAYSIAPALAVPAGTHTVTVGVGGTGNAGAAGNPGTDSWFISSTTVLAKGGAGGNPPVSGNGGIGGAGGSAAAGFGTTKFSGGNGGTGRDNSTGRGGPGATSAGTLGNGLSGAAVYATMTAPTPVPTGAGAGADGGNTSLDGIANISALGGGGGGAGDKNNAGSPNTIGGDGANGQVIITWVCPTYALTAAASNNGPFCNASASTITLRSSSLPTGTYNVTYNLSGATTATGNTATMTFTAGSPGTGTFSTTSLNIGATTVTITNLSSGAGCNTVISSFNTTVVTVLAPATSVAGTNISGCSTASSFNVTAGSSATNYTSVLWTSSGTGTFTNANSLTLCTYTPSVADIAGGTVTITLSASGNAPCGVVTSSKFLTVYQQPTAVAGSNISTCSAAGAVNITFGSSASNHSSVTWTSSGTGTFANPNSLSTCTYTPSAADIAAGSVTLTLTANSVACSFVTATKTLTILSSPTITSTTPGSRVGSGTVTLAATASAGTISWYANPTGGGSLGTGNSFTTPVLFNTTTYYVESFNGTCTSAPRVAVTATIFINEIDVQGNAVSIVDGDITPSAADWTDFGTASTRTFTIRNTGSSSLAIGAITFSGANPGDFAVTTSPSSVIGASSSTTFVVTFTPSAVGTRTASISIANNDLDENPYDFSIQGTGLAQEINVQGNATSIVDGDITPSVADWTDFGTTTAVYGSTTRTFTIQNQGAVNLTVGAITFTGTNAADYTVTTPPSATVAGYGSTTFVLTFVPGAAGVRTATMNIANNDTTENPYDFALQGTGTEPEISVLGNAVDIVDGDITPTAADWTDFGTTDVNTGSITRTFTITNTGLAPLTLGAITFSGTNPADFSVTTAPSATVASGSSTTFVVTFDPTAVGVRTAIINIANTDLNENPYNFTLQGTATAQEMDVLGNATSIVDGDTTPTTADWTDFSNLTTTRTFTIRNTGTSPLTIGAITFTGPNAGDFSISSAPAAIIIAGASSTFTVLFTPIGIGTSNATISIVNNDPNENPYDFAISGTAINNEIDIQGNGVSIVDGDITPTTADWTDFSTVATSRTFTILNTGATALTIGAITFSGTNPGDFSITTPPSASVAGYSSTTFVVRFTPGAAGARSAIMSIVNNDANENPYDFTLQGTGVAQEIDIQGNATSIVSGDLTPTTADWTDFSNVAITRTFTIRNTGTMNLTIGTITISGANPGDFSISTAPSAIVAGTTTSTFVITFAPTVVGVRTATITIPNNDSNESSYTFGISATSTSEIAISGLFTNIVDGDASPSQDDWTDFGSVSIENGNVLANYVITNTGTGPLVLGAITIAGANASDFTVTSAPAASVASGGSTIMQISFNPTVLGVKTATISIANNDIDENPFNFSITATGVRTYVDRDADNVTDNFDLDDDNDGIVDTLEQTSCLASPFASAITQTFLNETFGTGKTRGLININIPGASTTSCYEDGIAGNPNNCGTNGSIRLDDGEYCVNYYISHATDAAYPESVHQSLAWTDQLDHTPADTNGRMAIYNADNTAGTYFYQVLINGVLPNAPISFGFWVMNIMRQGNLGGTIRPNITIEFRDITDTMLYTSYNTGDIGRCSASNPLDNTCGPTLSNWLNYTTTVNLGNVTNFLVKIRNNAPGGGGNDFAMDDILIIQTYCDWDADGVANLFDLDSDNDGLADIEEGGFKQYSSGLSRMNMASSATWTDANANGMNDPIDPIYTGVNNAIPDTDGDGVRDAVDLDSDNDSLFDVDEAIANMGDGDINGDGRGDGVDTDVDGILDIYDTLIGSGTLARPFAQDTDSNATPDYMQVDSNSDGIMDIAGSLYSTLDANNDGRIDGSADVDKDGITDTFDTNIGVYGSPRDLNRKLYLDFDGRNDYGQDATALGVLTNETIMAWIDLNSAFSATGVVAGQPGFQLRINSSRNLEAVVNGSTITYSTPVAPYTSAALNTSQWYHVGAMYNGSTVRLFLNGVMVASGAAAGNIASAALTLGKNPSAASNYFKGKIDEVRIFNVALTDLQLQRMVYQEVQNTASQVRGTIVPKDIQTLPYANMLRNYRMDVYKDDIVDNITTASLDVGTGMEIYNNKIIKAQEAPMPFVTRTTGTFATAVNDATKDIRGMDVTDFDSSIIQVQHNITETANSTDLAMFVNSGVTITMNNDTKIQNDWYLDLDGKIDLQGKSQLVQTANSELDVTSAGSIERDQEGQANMFNYNYWCSPVGSLSTTANNTAYTVSGVMRDGTDPNNIQPITWTSGYNGAATSPITLSSYWIFKFQNLSPQYANWAAVGQNGTLQAAQGYTLKGTSAATPTQNYAFVGKPNNGTITTPIAGGNLNLCGNPYPSALDADAFITANSAVMTGALYFWEHYSTNTSHNLIDYQGGYAARNLVGGTPPVAPAGISGLGTSSRVPSRFIPVGQGFLVYAGSTGGTITFNNNQRAFIKENNASSNIMFRNNNQSVSVVDRNFDNTEDEIVDNNNFAKIRLGFNSVNGYHRQILLGFMDNLATEGFDPGYDAAQLDSQPNDLYFVNSGANLVIQGVDAFNASKILPLSVKNGQEGNVQFVLDATENFDDNQNIYIHDNVTNQYHDIRNGNFEVNLPIGTFDTRFSLRFSSSSLGVSDVEQNNEVAVTYTNNNDTININNGTLDATVESVDLFNMLGQSIRSWEVKNENQKKIQIPVSNVSTGTYIVKVHTTKGDVTNKIIIE